MAPQKNLPRGRSRELSYQDSKISQPEITPIIA
jgi:hypothetical protein